MSSLWKKSSYRANINFIIGSQIREYDISKANINVLRDANILSEEQYQYLLTCPKLQRQITIGNMQGENTNISKVLKDGITNARKIFMESNNIQDNDILAIRNDAITIIGNKPITKLAITDRVSFRLDGIYTSYYCISPDRANTVDLYYYYNPIERVENLNIKGLGDTGIGLHKIHMIDFISELLYTTQIEGVRNSIPILQNFHNNYSNLNVPIEYYREFNPGSRFRLKQYFSSYSTLYMDYATEYDKRFIDISYNEKVLRSFNKIFSSIYFGNK